MRLAPAATTPAGRAKWGALRRSAGTWIQGFANRAAPRPVLGEPFQLAG